MRSSAPDLASVSLARIMDLLLEIFGETAALC